MILFACHLLLFYTFYNYYFALLFALFFVFFTIDVCFFKKTPFIHRLLPLDKKKNKNNKKNVFTILIPVYNEEHNLEKLIKSIYANNLEDIHIVFINDNSNDNSLAILRNYQKKYEYKIITLEKQHLVCDVLNQGLKHLHKNTKHIGVINGDSIISINCFEKVKNRFQHYSIQALNLHNVSKIYNKFNLFHYYSNLEKEYRNFFSVFNEASLNNGYFIEQKYIDKWETITEDLNLTLKLKQKQITIYQDPSIIIYDDLPERWSHLMRQKFRWNYGDLYNRMMFYPQNVFDVIINIFFLFPLFSLFTLLTKTNNYVLHVQTCIILCEACLFFHYKQRKLKYIFLSFLYASFQYLFQTFFFIKYGYKHLIYKVEW